VKRVLAKIILVIGLIAIVGFAAGWAGLKYWAQAPGPVSQAHTVIIPKGSGVRAIAQQLEQEGLVISKWPFLALILWHRQASLLKAGEYEFPAHINPNGILDAMRRGAVVLHKVTVPEGWTVKQIFQALSENQILDGDVGALVPEGSLMPDTYHVVRGENRQALIGRMQAAMQKYLDDLWAKKPGNAPFQTLNEAVTLASIVERETGISEERARVAGVFINRLRAKMPLQADPTVIYALSNGLGVLPRPLTRADWKYQHPYNTYVINGLPPGPIANPGRAALRAVFYPETHKFYYFMATGDGGHAFSEHYEAHLREIDLARQRQKRLATP